MASRNATGIEIPPAPPRPQPRRPLPPRKKPRRVVHENSVLLTALAGGSLGVLISLILLWTGDYTSKTQWTGTIFIVGFWLSFGRSEQHTSELQSRFDLVCRLLLEKKKKKTSHHITTH